jgi:hypothetical protein
VCQKVPVEVPVRGESRARNSQQDNELRRMRDCRYAVS